MIPLWGNINQSFYGDIVAKYGDDRAWLFSAGMGARKIHNNTIFGAYLFGDYNKTPNANYFTVLNPGIEFMTNQWDGHLNGYLPITQRNKLMGVFTGNQVGIPNTFYFTGHTAYDKLFDLIENVGPGADMEVGHTFSSLNRTRIFAGSYYFSPKYTSNVKGLEAGFETPLKYKGASIELRDSYDNVMHNTFALTVRFTFGGLDKTGVPDIHDRMLDRIPRHLGNLHSGDGIPSQKKLVDTGRRVVVQNNIWFFNPGNDFASPTDFQSCTFEHPCLGLSQARIDAINGLSGSANFYLSSGTYNNPLVGAGYNFYNGQNLFGRTSNFMQLATGGNRALINDSLIFNGNSVIYNVKVDGHTIKNLDTGGAIATLQIGLLVPTTAIGDVNIYNSDFSSNSITNNTIAVANNSNLSSLNIYNSTIASSNTNLAGSITAGAGNLGAGKLNITNSAITATGSDIASNFNLVFGVINNEAGLINIENSSIVVASTNGGLLAGVLNNSTDGSGLGTVSINQSTISANGNNVGLVSGIFNQANNGGGVSSDINVNQTVISITSNINGGGTAAGIFSSGTGKANINNSVINATGDSGNISGITVADPTATVNLLNTTIALNISGTATGAPIQNGGTFNDNGGNQCLQNGVVVPC
jgi:hypothetical protein